MTSNPNGVTTTMRCPECLTGTMTPQPHVDQTIVGGHTVTNDQLKVNTCNRCGEYVLSDHEFEYYELRAAKEVLSGCPRVRGEVLRFVRKALGLKAWMFAKDIGLTADQVIQWEKGNDPNGFGWDPNLISKLTNMVNQKFEDLHRHWTPNT